MVNKTTVNPGEYYRENQRIGLSIAQRRLLLKMDPSRKYTCATSHIDLGAGLQTIRCLAQRGLVRFIPDREEGYEQWSQFSLTWAGVYVRRCLWWRMRRAAVRRRKPFHVAIREIQFVSVNAAAK